MPKAVSFFTMRFNSVKTLNFGLSPYTAPSLTFYSVLDIMFIYYII